MRSRDAAAIIGCSYRQLDHLTRTGVIDGMSLGSGHRRQWDPGVVLRLALAFHLASAVPGSSVFPEVAAAVVRRRLPDPPRQGFVLLEPESLEVVWVAELIDAFEPLAEWGAVLVVAYDLDEIVGGRADIDALVAAA